MNNFDLTENWKTIHRLAREQNPQSIVVQVEPWFKDQVIDCW